MGKILTFAGVVVLILVLIIAGPLLVIWALNTLFPIVTIAYTWETWLAVLILGAFINPSVKVKK